MDQSHGLLLFWMPEDAGMRGCLDSALWMDTNLPAILTFRCGATAHGPPMTPTTSDDEEGPWVPWSLSETLLMAMDHLMPLSLMTGPVRPQLQLLTHHLVMNSLQSRTLIT